MYGFAGDRPSDGRQSTNCPEFLDRAVELHSNAAGDLTHYLAIPLGTGVEVISQEALTIAYQSATENYQKEHVSPFIYANKTFFRVLEPVATGYYHAPDLRVTVDTREDFEKVKGLFERYRDKAFVRMEDVIDFFRRPQPEPELSFVGAAV
jgi:spore coat polysaccharide biosynthesis protein SpsF